MSKFTKYGLVTLGVLVSVFLVLGFVEGPKVSATIPVVALPLSSDPELAELERHAAKDIAEANELERCTDKGYGISYCTEQIQMKKAMAPGGALDDNPQLKEMIKAYQGEK